MQQNDLPEDSVLGIDSENPRWEWVTPQWLNSDRVHYQRPINPDKIQAILADPDQIADECCLVGYRTDDETYWVLDGQHHVLAALVLGAGPFNCRVFDSGGWKDEAKAFRAFTRAQTQIHAAAQDTDQDGLVEPGEAL